MGCGFAERIGKRLVSNGSCDLNFQAGREDRKELSWVQEGLHRRK